MIKPIRVLYVDDDRSFLEIVKVILEKDGVFLVSISSAGDEALNLLDQGEYDIVLSDCRMVRMDGIRFREKVRDMHPGLPFIFFTGREKGENISRLLDCSTFYLQKSGDPEVQFARLADLIISCLRQDTC